MESALLPSTNPMKSSCVFVDHEVRSQLKQKRKLARFVHKLIYTYTKKESSLSYIFCSDTYLWQMNQEYLNHDTLTDIITFDLSEKGGTYIQSDIYISIDRVKENAALQGVPVQEELLRVILHGALHLSGFKDKRKSDKEEMRAMENQWMKNYQRFT